MNATSRQKPPETARAPEGVAGALAWRRRLDRLWTPLVTLPLDAAAVVLSFHLAYLLRFEFQPLLAFLPVPGGFVPAWGAFLSTDLVAIVPVWLFFLYSAGLYRQDFRPFEDEFLGVLQSCLFGGMATLAVGFLYHRFENSRLMILLAFPVSVFGVLAARQLSKRAREAAHSLVLGPARVLVLGNGKTGEFLRRRFEAQRNTACISLDRGAVPEIVDTVTREGVSEVILTQMELGKAEVLRLASEMERLGVELKIVPGFLELRMGEVLIDNSLGLPTFRICHSSFSGANFAFKRAFDLLFCAAFFTLGALPLAVIALLIKFESRGPILFRQRRVGYKGRGFDIFKFRTMAADAESRLDNLKHLNERSGPVFKLRNDPRVTLVGRWLRRFSIDEVPQFLNVLKGEMSVVGPRPALPREVSEYDETAAKRLNVLPGVTGLGQVSGRADLDFERQLAFDLYYIEHWSPGLDLKIILKTPGAVLSSKGAY